MSIEYGVPSLSKTYFLNFVTKDPIIEVNSTTTNSKITIEFCVFRNLSVSNSGHAGAVFLSYFEGNIKYNDFIKCQCLNSAENDAGNSIKASNGIMNIEHCLVDKCTEEKAAAESAVSIRYPTSLSIAYSNFTNNVAQFVEGSKFGSPSVECQSNNNNNLMKFVHIEIGKGSRAVCFAMGKMISTNIIRFKGLRLLSSVKSVIDCCFFNNKVSTDSINVNTILNCLTDDSQFNKTTTMTTMIVLENNARWDRNGANAECSNAQKLNHILVGLLLLLTFMKESNKVVMKNDEE